MEETNVLDAEALDERAIIDDFNEFEENSRNKWRDLFEDIKDARNYMSGEQYYDDDKNMVEITFVWDVTASDIAWASAAERKQEILNLVNIKKIDRALPELIERAEAGIEIEVELADGTDAATITYPNIATFNAAARGEATDVNE